MKCYMRMKGRFIAKKERHKLIELESNLILFCSSLKKEKKPQKKKKRGKLQRTNVRFRI